MHTFLASQTSFATRPGNSWSNNGPTLQRKCACGQHTDAGGECEACTKNRTQGISLHEDVNPVNGFGVRRFAHDFSGLRAQTPTLFEEDLVGQPEPESEVETMSGGGFPTEVASPLDTAQPSAAVQTGETACDVDTGKATASTANTNECTKDCSMAHEKIHVADISACCAKAHEAKQKATTEEEKNKVHDQMKEWVDLNRPFLECRGYSESVKCAEKKLKALQCETASPRPKCCTPLVWYLRSATMNRDANCNNAGKSLTACPF